MQKLVFVLAALFTIPAAQASEVTGAKAKALYEALKDAGAKTHHRMEVTSVAVAGVRAGTALTGRGKFGSLEMRDLISHRLIRLRDPAPNDARPALALVDALKAVGVHEEVRMGGSSLDEVREVSCTLAAMMRPMRYTCSISR